MKETSLKNWGFEVPSMNKDISNKISATRKKDFGVKLKEYLNLLHLKLSDPEYIDANYKHNWKCEICGNIFINSWFNDFIVLACLY